MRRRELKRCARQLAALPPDLLAPDTAAANRLSLAFADAWTGDKTRAIEEYAQALQLPFCNVSVHEMRRHPRYQPLQGDPRFEALLDDPKNHAPLS